MGWNTEPTWQAGVKDQPTLTDFNQLFRDNGNYLLGGRPNDATLRDNGASYSSASTTFVNIDGTNLSKSILVNSGKVMVVANLVLIGDGTAGGYKGCFDFTVDGTRYGTGFADGIAGMLVNLAAGKLAGTVSFSKYVSGLTTGVSHTFALQYKTDVGTVIVASGNGVAGQDFATTFDVFEIG